MIESRVSNGNFFTVLGWMVKELNLKGNELMVFAIIHGFSQTEGQAFTGSLQYLADWTNSTKQGVLKNLKSLSEKGYIEKREMLIRNVKVVEYASKFNTGKLSLTPSNTEGYSTQFNGVLNSVERGIKLSLPNNIDNNIEDNIDKSNISINESQKKPSRASLQRQYEQEFEEVWSKYPRKEGKANALKYYVKYRLEGVGRNDILDGIERYARMCRNENRETRYIKQGSAWFNQRGWEDQYGSEFRRTLGTGTSNNNAEIGHVDGDKEVLW